MKEIATTDLVCGDVIVEVWEGGDIEILLVLEGLQRLHQNQFKVFTIYSSSLGNNTRYEFRSKTTDFSYLLIN